ncbi:DUF512 domain-containing protein [Fuchsiella alkaliacetigena]|uniref:DUF512 domain-containing protein n=1 Tax=Fuchsiella alkaliacetigena TaxID=957042 RepID=UPI00200B3BC6|nr:DUF512 domain-containing protein [Fuchsiella alkaliacetigena]MCK8824134.1 DUF512 domain-containing protein [Fuchsiella alkaliacetigena]
MSSSLEELIYFSAQEYNILPVTSKCNLDCLFCSHRYNPPEVKVFTYGHRSLEQIKDVADFLDPAQKIVIGESTTTLVEGEPFVNPDFKDILLYLRRRFPKTKIQITTNGSLLDRETVELLATLNFIELNVSLNTASLEHRQQLMDCKNQNILQQIGYLARQEVTYHGSIVALPTISSWDDLENTIDFLNQNNAKTIRVFLPGCTKLAPQELQFDLRLWLELNRYLDDLNYKYRVPITVEPPLIENLKVKLRGSIEDSPADKSGLRRGDQLLKVEGAELPLRVEAFKRLVAAEDPQVEYKRAGRVSTLNLRKSIGDKSGVVLDYDIDLARLEKIKAKVEQAAAERVVILTSLLGQRVIKLALEELMPDLFSKIDILLVKNRFFGGNIMAAGLLVVSDFLTAIEKHKAKLKEVDLVLIPQTPFNKWGNDLTGSSYEEIESRLEAPLVVL